MFNLAVIALFLCALHGVEEDLGSRLEPFLEKHELPALAAAVVHEGNTVATGVTGVRRMGSENKAERGDAFHLGSCTKAMTATLAAMLIEEGKLDWSTTLADVFPDLEMHAEYRKVTLEMLVTHRAGLPPSARSFPTGKTILEMHKLPGTAREQRRAYLAMMLEAAPDAKPGARYIYSNVGFVAAGAMAEEVTCKAWEELMVERIFKPLGMKTAGFGAMGTQGKIDQPWQHREVLGKTVPVSPGPISDNPAVIGPAGTVHCSIGDWAKFIAFHLGAKTGDKPLLKPESFERLHTPTFGGTYAGGWVQVERGWGGGKVLNHSGSNSMNYATVWMAPRKDFAVLVATNQGGTAAAKACDEVASSLIKKYVGASK
jgi:CubicO group peptidase (beta-lactamase class C family)